MLQCEGSKVVQITGPELSTFEHALHIIESEASAADRCLVAIDQPTIVPNLTGARPVDRVAGSLISWLGGGVQPASRARIGMFDDGAPIWRFKARLTANDDPEAARIAVAGRHLIEVFPALALPSLAPAYCGRLLGPRYNPGRRRTFRLEHWHGVLECLVEQALANHVPELVEPLHSLGNHPAPKKSHQDMLDSVICALVGYLWMFDERDRMLVLGDLDTGYIVTPAAGEARVRLLTAAGSRSVWAA